MDERGLRDLILRDFFLAAGFVDSVWAARAWTSGATWPEEVFESVDLGVAGASLDCGNAIGHATPSQMAARKNNLEEFPDTSL